MNKPTEDNAHGLFNVLSEHAELINWFATDPEAYEPAAAQYKPLFYQINKAGQACLTLLDTWAHYERDEEGRPHRAERRALVIVSAARGEPMEDDSAQFPEAVTSFTNTLDKNVLFELAAYFAFIYAVCDEIQGIQSAEHIQREARASMDLLNLYAPEIIASAETDDKPEWHKTGYLKADQVCDDFTKHVLAVRASERARIDMDKLAESLADLRMYGRLLAEIDSENGDMDADTLAHLGSKIEATASAASECIA